jgi:hypothetical protein
MRRTLLILLLGIVLGGYAFPRLLCWHWRRCGVLRDGAAGKELRTVRG